jgi:rfaE bifunctional protein kinase chain/domain
MIDLSTTIRHGFAGRKIVILGDLVADQFLSGTISRVSREAPVFILHHDETETLAGGAANAAVNVASLGGNPALIGLIGEDENGRLLSKRLLSAGVNCDLLISSNAITTTTKVRILAGQHYAPRQQVIRIDYENRADIGVDLIARLKENLERTAANADAIVISDYGYGVASGALADTARKLSREKKIPLLIDSRFHLRDFQGSTTATPNQEEVEVILGKDFTDADCERLRDELDFESLLVTCGNKGMLLVERGKQSVRIDAVGGLEPVDVTGAGDTVVAVYALGLAAGLSSTDAAHAANHAGGVVVMKKGTASVTTEELLASVESVPIQLSSETAS